MTTREFLRAALRTNGSSDPSDHLTAGKRVQKQMTLAARRLPAEGPLPSFAGATGWLNSEPLTETDLSGRVVLVQFWTYTCINWLRTLPYVREWAEKYRDHGLVTVGVHTPEFEFEKDLANVRRAANDLRIEYPIAIDSDYAVWHDFSNHYWPAMYLADAEGTLRHHHFGEGGYEQSEHVIQQLLASAGSHGVGNGLISIDGVGAEAAADWEDLRSSETYIGLERSERFGSPSGPLLGQPRVYALPEHLKLNYWALSGDWTMDRQGATTNDAEGVMAYRFSARDLHLVMGPAVPGGSVRFRVRIDGEAPGASHGVDVDAQGNGTVTEQRLYQLVRQSDPVAERTFEITFLDPGAQAFVFTFG